VSFLQEMWSIAALLSAKPDTLVLMGLPGVLFFAWRRRRAREQAR
jgi:hypothetical protein